MPKVLPVIGSKVINCSALFTTWTTAEEVLASELLSPGYAAVIECEPTEREVVVKDACPLPFRAELAITVLASLKVTVPVGVLEPAVFTVPVNWTDWPNCEGFALEVRLVVVLLRNLISRIG